MKAADAARIVAELGLTEKVAERAKALPPPTDEQIEVLGRLLFRRTEAHNGSSPPPKERAAQRKSGTTPDQRVGS